MVKESKGQLGVLATRRALYRVTAEKGFEMVTHIFGLRQLQEELRIMDNLVSDKDFVMILLTSLLESHVPLWIEQKQTEHQITRASGGTVGRGPSTKDP